MPRFAVEIPEVWESITRPVVMQVTRDMFTSLGVPQDTPIMYVGGGISTPQPGSTLDDHGKVKNTFPTKTKFKIEVSEDYPEADALSMAVFRPEQNHVFMDSDLGIYVKPAYQRAEVTITVTYRTSDRTDAELWQNKEKRIVGRGKDDYLTDVTYHYPIPPSVMVILCELHRMREENKGYGEPIGKWLKDHFSPKFTTISNQAGNGETVVIRENQVSITGWFDFGHTPPQFQQDGEGGAWETDFTFKFFYDKPETVVMDYPLMIHNNIVGPQFRDDSKPYSFEEDFILQPSLSKSLFQKFGYPERAKLAWQARPGLPIPHFDDWLPDHELPVTQCITRLLLQVDPADKRAIINLADLGNWKFKTTALAYMLSDRTFITSPRESVFSLTLHRKQELMDISKLQVTQGLDVFYQEDLDERQYYHLVVSVLTDLTYLSLGALRRLSAHGAFAIDYLKMLDPSMVTSGKLPILLPGGEVNFNQLREAAMYAAQRRYLEKAPTQARWNLVGSFVIQADRR